MALPVLLAGAIFIEGCSDVKFSARPSNTCQQYARDFGPNACILGPDGETFNYSVQVGNVDILFVDDNSGSMYTEQVHMADRFPGFLDSIYRLDYQIAIITTDTVKDQGRFLPFPNSQTVLKNSSRLKDSKHYDNIQHFQNTIKRPETLVCDNSGYTNCPSGDERGIFALNLALDNSSQRGFFRPGGHLAVVILSDEDERSNGGQIPGYPLEPERDSPESFVGRLTPILGATKTVSVHSIIIRPGDTSCFSVQNSQGAGVKGFYGYQYAALSQPTNQLKSMGNITNGVLGNICSGNYTAELGDIATQINQSVSKIQLPCRPENDDIEITFDPAPNQQIYYTIDIDNRVSFSPAASAGTRVNLKYTCKN